MSSLIVPQASRRDLPVAPVEIQDAVELFARKSGRHAKVHFVPNCGWLARFELKQDDARMTLYQEQKTDAPPTEDVWFHVPNPRAGEPNGRGGRESEYLPLDLYQMGVSGVEMFLEKGDTWSGRGEFNSVEEAVAAALKQDKEDTARWRAEQKEASRLEQRDKRRSRFGIPMVPVGIDLTGDSTAKKGE